MSNITTYVGSTGVGLTYVISRITRKRLDGGKTVLTICSLVSKGVEFHIVQRAAGRSGEEVSPYITSVISNACKEAIGYIRGTCMMDPVVKPHSWAGSNVADALKRLLPQKKEISNV